MNGFNGTFDRILYLAREAADDPEFMAVIAGNGEPGRPISNYYCPVCAQARFNGGPADAGDGPCAHKAAALEAARAAMEAAALEAARAAMEAAA